MSAPGITTVPVDPAGHLAREDAEVITIGGTPCLLDTLQCAACGSFLEAEVTASQARVTSPPCPCPAGITTVITIPVPSGRLIVTDDLRPAYDGFSDDFATYNSVLGQHQVIEAFAALGCAFGPVGNSCPHLYSTGPSSYVIASVGWDDWEDHDDDPPVPAGWSPLAWVCTDLWAYSIADHDAWAARGGSLGSLRGHGEIIAVPPGTYQFTHRTGERGFDGWAAGTIIYAEIERLP